MTEWMRNSNFNFVGNRKIGFWVTGILILITLISLIAHGGPNWSIDFVGGTSLQYGFDKSVIEHREGISKMLSEMGYSGSEVKPIEAGKGGQIQLVLKSKKEATGVEREILASLQKMFPDQKVELLRNEMVGPKVGKELQKNTFWAVVFALLVIVGYMAIRFQLPFGIAAVFALFHDTIITIGFFSVMGWEISLPIVAALLTLIGYSLNDTIVVFDRIREYMHIHREDAISLEDIINESVNSTLGRTVNTSLTTFLATLSIFIFFLPTEDVLKYFAACLMFGIAIGTYSSIFVASPLLIYWDRKWPLLRR